MSFTLTLRQVTQPLYNMAKLELPIERLIERQLKLDPDFDIELERDARGKIKKACVDKDEITKVRDKKK